MVNKYDEDFDLYMKSVREDFKNAFGNNSHFRNDPIVKEHGLFYMNIPVTVGDLSVGDNVLITGIFCSNSIGRITSITSENIIVLLDGIKRVFDLVTLAGIRDTGISSTGYLYGKLVLPSFSDFRDLKLTQYTLHLQNIVSAKLSSLQQSYFVLKDKGNLKDTVSILQKLDFIEEFISGRSGEV